jgi:hypothetical protein
MGRFPSYRPEHQTALEGVVSDPQPGAAARRSGTPANDEFGRHDDGPLDLLSCASGPLQDGLLPVDTTAWIIPC